MQRKCVCCSVSHMGNLAITYVMYVNKFNTRKEVLFNRAMCCQHRVCANLLHCLHTLLYYDEHASQVGTPRHTQCTEVPERVKILPE